MSVEVWRLVASLAQSRIRGLPERVLWGMGVCICAVRAKREATR